MRCMNAFIPMMQRRARRRSGTLLAILLLFPLTGCVRADDSSGNGGGSARPSLTVFAAASTSNAMTDIARLYESTRGARVVMSFGASSTLARQIGAGAPVDLYLSADQTWTDHLAETGQIEPESRRNLLKNELVLIAPADSAIRVSITPDLDITEAFAEVEHVAVADPAHVPAGRYAQQALQSLGWWTALESRLIPAQDVRAALRLIEIGEAEIGIVYTSDAASSSRVRTLDTFPGWTHELIVYPIAICAETVHRRECAAFLEFLHADACRDIFERHGFHTTVPER